MNKENPRIIKTPFPLEKYELYKKKIGVSKESYMSEDQIKILYILAVEGFRKGEISTDGLAMICNKLFLRVTKLQRGDPDLLNAIIAGSELSYYVRQEKLLNQFNSFLREVLQYSEKWSDKQK